MIKKFLLCILSVFHFASWANDVQLADTLTVEIYYRQGSSQLDFTCQHNQRQLDSLSVFLHRIFSDSTFRPEHIYIVSGASPEAVLHSIKYCQKTGHRVSPTILAGISPPGSHPW